ncbi:MAG TPA: large conductance mechanosensitive channel protein MscL [Acidimicrobiales bacterium]
MKATKSVSSVFREFRTFVLRANAVDLAIGVALGAAFTAVIQSIVTDLFTPLIAAIWGNANFPALSFEIHGSKFLYGLVINALISFIIVAVAVFFLVVKPMNAVRRRLGHDSEPQPRALCPACFTEIDLRARRCPACTEVLNEHWARDL